MAGPRVGGLGYVSVIPAAAAAGPAAPIVLAASAIASALPALIGLFRSKPGPGLKAFQVNPTYQTAFAARQEVVDTVRQQSKIHPRIGMSPEGEEQLFQKIMQSEAVAGLLQQINRYLYSPPAPAAPVSIVEPAPADAPIAALPELAPESTPIAPRLPSSPVQPSSAAPAAVVPYPVYTGGPMEFNTSSPIPTGTNWPSLIGQIWGEVAPIINKPKPVIQAVPVTDTITETLASIPWWVYVLGGIVVYQSLASNNKRRR